MLRHNNHGELHTVADAAAEASPGTPQVSWGHHLDAVFPVLLLQLLLEVTLVLLGLLLLLLPLLHPLTVGDAASCAACLVMQHLLHLLNLLLLSCLPHCLSYDAAVRVPGSRCLPCAVVAAWPELSTVLAAAAYSPGVLQHRLQRLRGV
jgi:hypothetical protein